MPLPLLAAQIIWLNFVTDGFLDVSLAMEPKEKGLLLGSFERPKKYLIDKIMLQRMIIMAIPMMIGTLFLFQQYVNTNIEKAWTVSLTTLAVFDWFIIILVALSIVAVEEIRKLFYRKREKEIFA